MSRIGRIIELGSTVLVAAVALVMAGAYFSGRSASGSIVPTGKEGSVVQEWERVNAEGIRRGPADANIVITEFIDFQCPYCARLRPGLDSVRQALGEHVALVFHHFPLSGHEHAVQAAVAAECAHRQGRFWPMYDALLSRQQQFGAEPWESYAADAGVPDRGSFTSCLSLPPDSFPRIAYGRSQGERTGVRGTPTIWVNGRVSPPNTEAIARLARESR